jgi:hypothetical protein
MGTRVLELAPVIEQRVSSGTAIFVRRLIPLEFAAEECIVAAAWLCSRPEREVRSPARPSSQASLLSHKAVRFEITAPFKPVDHRPGGF